MRIYRPSISLCFAIALAIVPLFRASAQEKVIITATDTVLFNIQPDEEEYRILAEFFQRTNGKKWKNSSRWLKGKTSADMARWHGVVVRDGDISEIHLEANGLQGEVPESLYKLAMLTSISLDGNAVLKQTGLTTVPENVGDAGLASRSAHTPAAVISGRNLPEWGLTVKGLKVQKVDWRQPIPAAVQLSNSTPTLMGSSGVAIDDCGRLAFYVLHSGSDGPNRLHIYAPDGTRLTNDTPGDVKQALSSANSNIELQVVPVPGTADEWFIIYSSYQTPCLDGPSASVYCPAKVVYAKVKYNTAQGLIMTTSKRAVSISDKGFIQGKAVSRTVNGNSQNHYLYMAGWETGGLRVHRFIIDATGISFGTQSAAVAATEGWASGIAGSSVELSPDEKMLAISNRNVSSTIYGDIILFDLSKFNNSMYQPTLISVPELVVHGTGGQTISQIRANGRKCWAHIKNKLGQIEFSPSGRYLYALHGGYKNLTGGVPYDTYLFQIDLQSGADNGKFEVRMLVETGKVTDWEICTGPSDYVTKGNPLQQIQSAYNGRLYFTKSNSATLFVIPYPDEPIPHSITPGIVDLSTADVPNIVMYGGDPVLYLPENIDGYDYITPGGSQAQFTLSKDFIFRAESLTLTATNFAGGSYQVSWGDGVTENLTSPTLSHIYSEHGEYTVTLSVLDAQQCAAVMSRAVKVFTCATIGNLEIENKRYLCANRLSVSKLDDCIATYEWDLGDGAKSASRSVMHAYNPRTEPYHVSLYLRYDCGNCRGDRIIETDITVTEIAPVPEEVTVYVPTDNRVEVISSSATTFSETWPLEHHDRALSAMHPFVSGAQGVWRPEGSFLYNTPRSASAPVNVSTDGTYTLEYFNWEKASLEAIPKWIKTGTITRYNAFGFELENRDVLGIYSAALYDYNGQLQSAQGANMRNDEMAFTSFEGFNNKPTGNLTFSNNVLPEYNEYQVTGANEYIVTVAARPEDLALVDRVNILVNWRTGPSWFPFRSRTRYLEDVKIVCRREYPDRPDLCVLVFEDAPYGGLWTGKIIARNMVIPVAEAEIDNAVVHTGESSMKITADKLFEQKFLRLDAGKNYYLSAWVSVNNSAVVTPTPPANLGIDVVLKNKYGATIATKRILPEGAVIEGWQQVKGSFICPEDGLIVWLKFKKGTAAAAWYDDVRIHPENGNMKSYVYNTDDLRLRAILDEDNFASVFYYDKEGNLYLTKKETEDGIKTVTENISYQVEKPQN